MGMNLLCSPVFGGSLARSKELIGSYREALAAGEHDENGKEVGALTMVYVGETVEKAREEFSEAVLWYFHHFGKYVAPKLGQPAIKGYEMYTEIRDMAKIVEWDMLLEAGAVICGDADFVCEKIDEVKREHGIGHFLMWTRLGGLRTELVMAHMERMRDKVMPNFR
jgi:alkanesulfonate monooxygenase SsuD/methylene tetrahydromethanopterin reductase-like flavin-dependent oxidoreductase (luciferase family)